MISRTEAAEKLKDAVNDADFLLIRDKDYVSGADGATGLNLVGRCLLAAENGCAYDDAGNPVTVPTNLDDNEPPAELENIQNAIRVAREAEVDFVLCFHVEGDHRWHLEWSKDYDFRSAMAAVWQFVQSGMVASI